MFWSKCMLHVYVTLMVKDCYQNYNNTYFVTIVTTDSFGFFFDNVL